MNLADYQLPRNYDHEMVNQEQQQLDEDLRGDHEMDDDKTSQTDFLTDVQINSCDENSKWTQEDNSIATRSKLDSKLAFNCQLMFA